MITPEQKALNERFLAALDHLAQSGAFNKGQKYSRPRAIVACLGIESNYTATYMAGIKANRRKVPFDGAVRFCEIFGLNKYWMVFGEGEMIDAQKDDTP